MQNVSFAGPEVKQCAIYHFYVCKSGFSIHFVYYNKILSAT